MTNRHFKLDALETNAMHAEPIGLLFAGGEPRSKLMSLIAHSPMRAALRSVLCRMRTEAASTITPSTFTAPRPAASA
jgi:hypothetical protein